ncbi:hypothetical protein N9V90_02115 [Endozoicomonas sp.]|nr:hypothetical protein [Endozoicomonas sp.]
MSSERISSPTAATPFDPELDPIDSLMDLASDAYLQKGALLDTEVRSFVDQIELSNSYLHEINKLISESNRIVYGNDNVTEATWNVTTSGNTRTVYLDNSYRVVMDNGITTVIDSSGNQLAFANGVLIPTAAGEAAGAAIALNANTTLILDDGTKITIQPNNTMGISRGNQSVFLSALDGGGPIINGPLLNQQTDANISDGEVLIENGGVHSWLNAGSHSQYATSNGILTAEQRAFIANQLDINLTLPNPMTAEAWQSLKSELTLVRDNLTGSNQLQTVKLQSALTRYNQNFDAMSNSQNKLYTLLKDILGNLK